MICSYRFNKLLQFRKKNMNTKFKFLKKKVLNKLKQTKLRKYKIDRLYKILI